MILRHAKTERNRPGSGDFDRMLTERGEAAARDIGTAIAEHGLEPELALCSPSRRTRQTLELVLAAFSRDTECRYVDEIYEAGPTQLLRVVQRHGGAASPLLVVGHNPGLQAFALDIAGAGPAHDIEAIRDKFPTGALAVFDADLADWGELRSKSARLEAYLSPRALV